MKKAGYKKIVSDITEMNTDITEMNTETTEMNTETTEMNTDITEISTGITETSIENTNNDGKKEDIIQKRKPGIYIENISKSFGEQRVLENVNIYVEPGVVIGLVGNNGSGKTVLMKCICGFLKPDSGHVYVGGKEIGMDCDFPESIGIIIETPGFLPNLSGYKNLKILARLKGKIGKKEIYNAMETVGLEPGLRKTVSKYSLGMRQKLGIAQAIMENPDYFVLDEPFNGLDKGSVAKMRNLILDLKKQGKTMILASHNAADIEMLCDRVYDMEMV